MTAAWLRFAAIAWVALLGGGVLIFMGLAVRLGPDTLEGGGWLTAGFLALREVYSKIENIALGIRTAPPAHDEGEG